MESLRGGEAVDEAETAAGLGSLTPDPLWRKKAAALEASPDGIALADAEGRIIWCNAAFAGVHGFGTPSELLDELKGRAWPSLYGPSERARLEDSILPDLRPDHGPGSRAEVVLRRAEGEAVPLELRLVRFDAETTAITARDLSGRRRRERALASREELFRLLADHSTDLIALHEPDGTYVYASPSVRRMLGYGRHELLGRLPWELAHPEHRDRVRDCLLSAARGEPNQVSFRARTRKGSYRWLEMAAQPIRDRGPESPTGQSESPTGQSDSSAGQSDSSAGQSESPAGQVVTCSRDITERKSLERALAHQALHDPLTGLPNRSLFMNRLEQARARARRRGDLYGILFLDLDGFKRINDSLGHAAGDELLQSVARRLDAWVRESDTVARLGGDEFAVLLEGLEDPEAVPPLVERVGEAFANPFTVAGVEARLRASIGVTVSRPGSDSPRDMLRLADQAMYEAKRSGGGSRFYRQGESAE